MPHTTWILYLTVALVSLARASTAVHDQASVSDISAAKLNASHPWTRVPLSDKNNRSRDSEPGVVSSVYSWLGSMFEGSPDADPKRDEDEEKKVWTQRNGASQQEEQLEKTGRTTLLKANQSYHRQPDRRPVFLPESISILENLVHPEEEVQDEINDAEIFRAVVTSLAEWNLQKILRRKEQRRHRRDEDIDYSNLQQSSPSEELNTRFLLYTRRNPDVPHIMTHSNANSIRTSPYNSSLPSKIIIHGFGGSCQRIWAKQMRKTLINVEDVNVICVDWENGASLPNYKRAADNTRLVGRDVGQLIGQLNNMTGSKNSDFHLIGFSLGAHVAGFAGSEVRNQTQSLLHRITGLDPAGPLFENDGPQDRLDSGDADLVDVIHSNGEKIYMGGLGAWAPMGDIDFYPNGGRMQKGCTNLFVGAVTDMIWSSAEENGRSLCNHRRAYKFFTDSVASGCHFPAFACESYEKLLEGDCFPCANNQCASMGYYADKSAGRGIMYLATREEEPFCANQYRVQLESTARPQPISSLGKIELILIGTNGFNFSEPFTLTKGPDFELVSGGKLVRLIVPHPNFSPPTIAQLTYTAYHGWISSGLPEWSVDKLMMTDSFGSVVSYCLKGTVLKSGKPMLITLQAGDCNPARAPVISNVLPRQPFEPTLQAMDNEIPVLELHRTASFRSLDNMTLSAIFSNSSTTTDKTLPANSGLNSGPAAPPLASRSNVTNIFPYGNVPLSLLQQQIPADIKVANRRPSFYQWPFVGASHAANFLFGNHGNQVRARLKSLGGGRKQEPNLQLTPPSLQNSVAAKDSPTAPPGPRRPYFRRNQGQQLSIDEQNRAQYYLMRQQQLHLQQQQQLQQARQQPAAANPSAGSVYSSQQPNLGIQFGPQVAAGTLPQPVMHLQSPLNSQRGYMAQPSGFQWRPENAFNNPAIRFPLTPVLKADPTVSMPLDHMQQTFAQTLLTQNNQQHAESAAPSVRNQPQLPFAANPPAQSGGPVIIIASSIPLTGDDLVAVTPSLATAYSTSSSSVPPSSSVATMTILNTAQHSVSSSTVAASDVVPVSSTRTVPKLTAIESTDGELHESESVQTALTSNANSKGGSTETEAAEVVAQLATKSTGNRETGTNVPSVPSINLKPPPVEERPVVYVPVEEVPVLVDPAGFLNATITSAVDAINGKSDDEVERLPYAHPANPSMPAPPWTLFADNERTEVAPFVRYDFTSNGDVNVGGFLPDELYPNPQQLGQARDQYWATPRARRINNPTVGLYPVIQQFLTQPPPPPPPQSFAVASGSGSVGAAKWEDVNKPRYIPLNPVDRQNRQLRMQYYVDTSNKPAELYTTTSTSVL